jgi:hypothetical protein
VTANRHGELALLWDRVDSARIDCEASTIPTQSLFATLPAGRSHWTSPIAIGRGGGTWRLRARHRRRIVAATGVVVADLDVAKQAG